METNAQNAAEKAAGLLEGICEDIRQANEMRGFSDETPLVADEPPRCALKLRIRQEEIKSSEPELEIERKYPEVKFFYNPIQSDHVTEKSGIVDKTKGKRPQRRIFLLTSYLGKVKMKIPKGKSILEINKAGDSYQIFNACHIVILTQERSRFGLWKVTAGEIVNFGIGYRLPEFLDGVEYRLAKLTTSQGKD